MSIRARHADRIYRGDKRFEFRRQRPRFSPGLKVFIYEPTPIRAVTGHFRVDELADISNGDLRELEADDGERKFVESYLYGARRPTAIGIAQPGRLVHPVSLKSLGVNVAPQSYVYIPAR